MMKRNILLILLLLPVLVMAKPQSPLQLIVESELEPTPGSLLPFRVTAVSSVDISSATLKLELPQGVELIQGQLQQEITMQGGKAQVFEYRVLLLESMRGNIEVRISTPVDSGFYMTARGRIKLQDTGDVKSFSRTGPSPGYQKNENNGQRTREYHLH